MVLAAGMGQFRQDRIGEERGQVLSDHTKIETGKVYCAVDKGGNWHFVR